MQAVEAGDVQIENHEIMRAVLLDVAQRRGAVEACAHAEIAAFQRANQRFRHVDIVFYQEDIHGLTQQLSV